MDIQEDDTWCLLQLLCISHNSTEHTVTADGTERVAVGLA